MSRTGVELMDTYIRELYRWNEKMSLTSVKPNDARETLIEPSLAMIEFLPEAEPLSVIDIGSGGGFPAIVLAIQLPIHSFLLVESNKKKAAFLNNIAGILKLKNVKVVAERAETVAKDETFSGKADAVTARAVRCGIVFDAAYSLLNDGGKLLMHRSPKGENSDSRFELVSSNEYADCFTVCK